MDGGEGGSTKTWQIYENYFPQNFPLWSATNTPKGDGSFKPHIASHNYVCVCGVKWVNPEQLVR